MRFLVVTYARYEPWGYAAGPISTIPCYGVLVAAIHILVPWDAHRLDCVQICLVGINFKISRAAIARWRDAVVVCQIVDSFGQAQTE